MGSESEIQGLEARIEKRRERLAKVRRAAARIDAATLEDFEALDDAGRRRVFDADPELFLRHYEAIRERNMERLAKEDR